MEHIGSNATRKKECHRPLFAIYAFHSTASDAPTISFASPLLLRPHKPRQAQRGYLQTASLVR